MELFETVKVFNKELQGKAVEVDKLNNGKVCMVTCVSPFMIDVIDMNGDYESFTLSDFESGNVTIELLEKRKPTVRELNERYIQEQAEEIKIERFVEPYKKRTIQQKQVDNALIEEILKVNEKPMQLADIMAKMNDAGRKHWNTNNSSSFVHHAMKAGCDIKKISRGVYAIDKGVK